MSEETKTDVLVRLNMGRENLFPGGWVHADYVRAIAEITALRAALGQERADNAKLRAFAQEIVEEIYGEGLVKQMANANGLLNDDGQPTTLLSGRGEDDHP